MSGTLEIPAPAVLQNRGIPVLVHSVRQNDAAGLRFERQWEDDDTTPKLEKRWVRLTMSTQAGIEARWGDDRKYVEEVINEKGDTKYRLATAEEQDEGFNVDSMDLWQQALSDRPATTFLETYGLIWECTNQEAAALLVDTSADDYATALAGAYALAQGAGADAVVRLLKTGVSSAQRLKDSVREAVDAEVVKMEEEEAEALRKASEPPESETPANVPAAAVSTPTSPVVLPEQPSDTYSERGQASDVLLTSSGN